MVYFLVMDWVSADKWEKRSGHKVAFKAKLDFLT
jgi:hypothetical protein